MRRREGAGSFSTDCDAVERLLHRRGSAKEVVADEVATIREIYNAIISDLGGADRLSELEHQVVRRAVGLALQCEQIETQLAEGKPVDIAASATLINVFNRTASLLGLDWLRAGTHCHVLCARKRHIGRHVPKTGSLYRLLIVL